MKLIVGLGNPGPQYALTRHNVGFMVVDALTQNNQISIFQSRFKGLWASGKIDNQDLQFFKPLDFMNRSGPSIRTCASFYKISPEDILVIHDDIELEPGKIRVKFGGGHGGHNGLKSLESSIGKEFWRLKIGVGRPRYPNQDVADYVLERFKASEEEWLVPLLQEVVYFFPLLLKKNKDLFMTKVMQIMQELKK